MSFDLDAALRSLKPQRKRSTLARRSDAELSWVDEAPDAGSPILLDTTVYIDVLQGRTSARLDDFISLRTCNHSSVCVCELTHAYGRLRPEDERTSGTLRVIGKTIRDIPAHRLSAPDSDTWGRAGMLAGVLFRLGGNPDGEQRKCLNDALVYLQARKLGWPVVTRNVKDFDFLNQLVPDGRVLLYRTVS